MALIPGTLPNDTCYGTPQDLLELFAQYLDVPAFALNSKVVFGTSSAGLTADVVWFDTTTATNPIMKITVSGGFTDYIKNYITNATVVSIVGADTVLILDATDGNTKRGLVSDIVPAAGSVTFPMLSTSATESDNVASRVAKAWVYYNGVTNAILSDFNVSTVTDVGQGNFTVNFSSSLASSSLSVSGIGRFDGTNAQVICIRSAGTGSVGLYTGSAHAYGTNVGLATDVDYVSISVFSI